RRTGEGDAVLMQDPTDNRRVAVLVSLQLTPSVVDVEPVTTEAADRIKFVRRGVGAFDVAVPEALPCGKIIMECAKLNFLVRLDRSARDDQEVAVTRHVSGTKGEGPLQVGADEVIREDSSGNRHELFENDVEFVVRSWAARRRRKV